MHEYALRIVRYFIIFMKGRCMQRPDKKPTIKSRWLSLGTAALLACVLVACQKPRVAENPSPAKVERKATITATSEDLSRIIFLEGKPVDPKQAETAEDFENIPIKHLISTILSDGSGYREVCPQPDSWILAVTKDLKKVIHTIANENPQDSFLKQNVVIKDIKSGEIKEVFTIKDTELDLWNSAKTEKELSIWGIKIFCSSLFIDRMSSVWMFDLATSQINKYQMKSICNYLLPISNTECIANVGDWLKNGDGITRVGRISIPLKSTFYFDHAYDNFSLSSATVSENGNTICVLHSSTAPTKPAFPDTIYLFNRDFQFQKKFTTTEPFLPVPDGQGKWLYYVNSDADLYRIKITDIAENAEMPMQELVSRSQSIYFHVPRGFLNAVVLGVVSEANY